MATRVGLFKIPLRTLNSTNPKTPGLVQDFGLRSYVNQITDDSVSKFPNFRYYGNKNRFFKITMSLLRIFSGVMSGLCLGACMPNLMFEHLAMLEILTFNAQKMGSGDPDPTPFTRIFLWGHVGTLPGIMCAKFKVHIFSHFGAVGI